MVIFPVAKAAEGERFLKYVEAKRRFYFDNYFKRVLHRRDRRSAAADRRGPAARLRASSSATTCRRSTTTTRRCKEEIGTPLAGEAFAGEYEPVTLALAAAGGPGPGDRDGRRPERARRDASPPTRSTWATSPTASAA